MKDSGIEWIGEIPKEWDLEKIKYVLDERVEKNDPVKTENILSLTAKQGVVPLSEKEGGGNKPKENFTDYKLAYPGDIVMNSMNILSGSVGLSKYFGCVSPVYYMLRPYNDSYDVRFFNYIFQTKVFQLSLFGLGNGILIKESSNGKFNTIRMRIPMEKLGNLLIPVPSKISQKDISDYLDSKCSEIDATSEEIQKQISILEDYKKSVITEAVTKGLNPNVEMKDSGVEWIGEIPKDWNLTKIGMLYQQRKTKVSDCDYQPLSVTKMGVLPQLDNVAKTNAHDDRKLVKAGDFVINSRSDRRGSCGISDYDGSVSLINTVLIPMSYMHPGYYGWLFKTAEFADEFYRNEHGIVDDLWTTGWQDMKRIVLPVPSLNQQCYISDYLDSKCSEIDSLISEKKQQLDVLAEYKKSLIYEYVTGKKEV